MTEGSSRMPNNSHASWPTEFWVVVVPGLMFLTASGVIHLAERLEGTLQQMSIKADMVSGYFPVMLICIPLLVLFISRERNARALAFRMLVWAILTVAASLIADFLAAVAIQLIDPDTAPEFSEGLRMVLQTAIVLLYLLRAKIEHRKLEAASDSASEDTQ